MIIAGAPGTVLHASHEAFLRARLGVNRPWSLMQSASFGAYRGSSLVGVVLLHDWNPDAGTICLSLAGDKGWLTRDMLLKVHEYAFVKSDCQAAVAQVSERNKTAYRFAERVGYELTYVPRLRGTDEGEYICILPRERWAARLQKMQKRHKVS